MAFVGALIPGAKFDSRKILVREMANLDGNEDYLSDGITDGEHEKNTHLAILKTFGTRRCPPEGAMFETTVHEDGERKFVTVAQSLDDIVALEPRDMH